MKQSYFTSSTKIYNGERLDYAEHDSGGVTHVSDDQLLPINQGIGVLPDEFTHARFLSIYIHHLTKASILSACPHQLKFDLPLPR